MLSSDFGSALMSDAQKRGSLDLVGGEFSYQLYKQVYLLNSIGGRVHGAVGSHPLPSLKEL